MGRINTPIRIFNDDVSGSKDRGTDIRQNQNRCKNKKQQVRISSEVSASTGKEAACIQERKYETLRPVSEAALEFFKKDPCFDLIIILSPERKYQISGNTG